MLNTNERSSTRNIFKASVWSFAAEIVSKVASPLIFLIMTRLLSPEDFGIVAIAVTILGFVNIINDLGTSKIIIQGGGDEEYRNNVNNVAFWFNLTLGLVLSALVFIFARELAVFYGKIEATDIIRVMSVQILFFSLSSVQNANKCKSLDYKSLFIIRFTTIFLPAFISIPFAFMGFGFWALVFGQITGAAANTVMLWATSSWRPRLSLDLGLLRNVIGKSIWSTCESLLMWVPIVLDTFLITHYLSTRSLGLYSTSRSLYAFVTGLLLAPILPVLFSTLSLMKDDAVRFIKFVLFTQKIVFTISMIVGVGAFILREPIGALVFNKKWDGISDIFGIVFLVFGLEYFSSVILESYRAKGQFRLLAFNQILYVFITIPLLFMAIPFGLITYVWARSLLLLVLCPVYLIYSEKHIGIKPVEYFRNTADIFVFAVSVLVMATGIDLIITAPGLKYGLTVLMYILALAVLMYWHRNNFLSLLSLLKRNINI